MQIFIKIYHKKKTQNFSFENLLHCFWRTLYNEDLKYKSREKRKKELKERKRERKRVKIWKENKLFLKEQPMLDSCSPRSYFSDSQHTALLKFAFAFPVARPLDLPHIRENGNTVRGLAMVFFSAPAWKKIKKMKSIIFSFSLINWIHSFIWRRHESGRVTQREKIENAWLSGLKQ